MATIKGVKGKQFIRGSGADYEKIKYQYATSSYAGEDRMRPALIVQPQDIQDIATTLKYAKSQNIAVAIRSGGHQYCGASSTAGRNIQLDLSVAFRSHKDLSLFTKDGKTLVRAGVSFSLSDFNEFLGTYHVFVPHGQCEHVHLGGHVQTGGYGQLGRSFGLLGDHVVALEVVDHEGNYKEVTKDNDLELFHALLGGSPGNFAVITHVIVEVYRDKDYQGSVGLKALYWYSAETLKYLLDILVEMSEDENFPRNYDFCISVLSSSFQIADLFDESLDKEMKEKYPKYFGPDELKGWPRTIVVYAQWVPFGKTDKPNMEWFDRINSKSAWELKDLGFDGYNQVVQKPMSELTAGWIFRNVREFDYPYIKIAHMTNSTTLGSDGWAAWATDRVNALVAPDDNGCYLSAQFQNFGGKNSQFVANATNGTAYSWRDSTICIVLDVFYDNRPGSKANAIEWHETNEKQAIGPEGVFCKQDRRLLWGSFGDYNLNEVWQHYYDDEAKYERLRKARLAADPNGVLTPNPFCVTSAGLSSKSKYKSQYKSNSNSNSNFSSAPGLWGRLQRIGRWIKDAGERY